MSGETARLARFVVEEARPGDAQRALAVSALVDTAGAAIAGLDEQAVRIAGSIVADAAGAMTATVWGSARRVTAADAAYLNAIASHALDFDDNMPTLRGHPSTTLWPVALAAGELAGASGAQLLDGYVVGLEISGKLGLAFGPGHYDRGWHATSSIGIYGATAAAGRLLGLDARQMTVAWGLAASQMSGLLANFGTMAKPFHAGHAARCAIQSVLLARAGFTANEALLDEGPRSVFASYRGERATTVDRLVERLGKPWEVDDPGVFVKLWPCCYCSHRPLAGLFALMSRHAILRGEVQGIELGFPPGTDAGLVKTPPRDGLAGKFSVEYTAAAAVLDGHVGLETFTAERFARGDVQALMPHVRCHPIEDGKNWSSTVGYNDVAILTTRGRFAMRVDATPGAPHPPVPAAQLDAKFLDCAGRRLSATGAAQVLNTLRRIDTNAPAPYVRLALQEESE
jgi:2-methylcitrate dehydratase PrpD